MAGGIWTVHQRAHFALVCLFLVFFDGHCSTTLEVATCDDLVVNLHSCSKSLSLKIVQDLDCTSMSINVTDPITILEQCTIHGAENDSQKVPTIEWGSHKDWISVGAGGILTLENVHLKFANPRAASEGASVPPAFILEPSSQLIMNLVAVSFDVCADGGNDTSSSPDFDLLSLWLSRASAGGEGSFYFTEQMEIDHSGGGSSYLCDVGVHCGAAGDDPDVLGRFVESVTGGAERKTCLSMVDGPSSGFPVGKSLGIMLISVLCITVAVLLILLYWVRSHRKSRAAKSGSEMCSPVTTQQFLTPSGSMRSLVTRDELRDSPVNILHDLHEAKPQLMRSITPPILDPTVHVNPLFLQPGGLGGIPPSGKPVEMGASENKNPLLCSVGLESLPPTGASCCSLDSQLLEERLFETSKQISATLFRCGVVTEGPPTVLESGFSGVFQKGVYKGEPVAINIKEQQDIGVEWNAGRGLLQQSDLDHYNLVKVYFAMHGDLFNGEPPLASCKDSIAAGNEGGDSSPATGGSTQRSVVVMEYCDKGNVRQAVKEMVYFHAGPWGMPRISWILMTGIDVAEAMSYLHSHGIVHGNLTSKNILMKSAASDPRGLVCKVGNLHEGALSVALCTEPGEFRRGRADDVYSFGMLMHELILGYGVEPQEKSKFLDGSDARKPRIPANIPPFYRELLDRCWDVSIDRRPTFEEISKSLKGVLIQYYIEEPAAPASNSYDSDKKSASDSDQEGDSFSITNADIIFKTPSEEKPMDAMEAK
ncbi:hypothetical protein BSKO_11088 [Bryopsis sp. KO-2023]|nr:hypothetical protein BSKO_11088 [Bryopsis sp. KO-2023]